MLEGEDWLDRGEALTVFFGFIARIAPLWREHAGGRVRLMAGPPGAQVLAMPPLDPGEAAFVALMLARVSFDGLPTPSGGWPASASTRWSSPAAPPSSASTRPASSPPGR